MTGLCLPLGRKSIDITSLDTSRAEWTSGYGSHKRFFTMVSGQRLPVVTSTRLPLLLYACSRNHLLLTSEHTPVVRLDISWFKSMKAQLEGDAPAKCCRSRFKTTKNVRIVRTFYTQWWSIAGSNR